MTPADLFALPAMQRALIAAVVTGLAAPVVGTYLVQRRLALMGDGLGHVAVTGVALRQLVHVRRSSSLGHRVLHSSVQSLNPRARRVAFSNTCSNVSPRPSCPRRCRWSLMRWFRARERHLFEPAFEFGSTTVGPWC